MSGDVVAAAARTETARERRRVAALPVAVALTAWAGAAAATALPGTALPVALAGLAAALCALMVAVARASRRGRRGPATPTGPVLAVLVCGLVLLGAVGHAVLASAERGVAASLPIQGGRVLAVHGTVSTKVAPTGGGLGFSMDAERVEIAGRSLALGVPIAVWVSGDALSGDARAGGRAPGLDLGAEVTVQGSASVTEASRRDVLRVFADTLEVTRPPPGAFAVSAAMRDGFVALAATLPGAGGELLPGLSVGDTSAVSEELDAAMKITSLSHLTAVSGANCALIVAIAFGAAAALGLPRLARVAIALAALGAFVVLVTPEASVIRAGAMATIALIALAADRPVRGLVVLALAVAILLVGDPWLAHSLGFAMSAAATWALLVLAAPLARGFARVMPRGIALMLAVPLSAQLVCGPLIVLIDPAVPLLGVPANILAGPAAPAATVLGLLACLCAGLGWLGAAVAWIAWLPSSWVAGTAQVLAAVPGGRLPWPEGWPGAFLLAAIGAVVVVAIAPAGPTRRARGARAVATVSCLVCAGLVAGVVVVRGIAAPLVVPGAWRADWSIALCDVGQGDAVLLRSAGAVALVDTGPEPEPLERCLTMLGIDRIDLLVLTHFDADHVGAAEVLEGRVGAVVHGPPDRPGAAAIVDRLARGGARAVVGRAGMTGTLGDARWRLWWPASADGDDGGGRPGAGADASAAELGNDGSLVLEASGPHLPRTLLLGDLGEDAQRRLARGLPDALRADVVKVAHHGSADQYDRLYDELAPRLALIGVGENTYGHPRAEILQTLGGLGAVVARSDTDGIVLVRAGEGGAIAVWRERVGARRYAGSMATRAPSGRPSAARGGAKRPAAPRAKSVIRQVPWRRPEPAPIVLVSGPEEVCAERAIAGLREYLRAEDPSLEVHDIRADAYEPGTLLALSSPSLFGEPRLLRIAGVERCTDAFLAEAIAYLDAPQEGASVVLRHTGASVRGKKLLDAVRAGTGSGIEIACPALKRDSDRYDFAAGEFSTAGRRIAPLALRTLVGAFADDVTELAAACQQLLADVTGDITPDIVERYYGGRVEVTAFAVADTAIAGRYGDALVALRHALASGADPVPMVAAFAAKLRTMARVGGHRESASALAARLGLKDWQVDRARRDLVGWSADQLGMAIQAAARADGEVKGASRDPVFALERLVTVVATRAPFGG